MDYISSSTNLSLLNSWLNIKNDLIFCIFLDLDVFLYTGLVVVGG